MQRGGWRRGNRPDDTFRRTDENAFAEGLGLNSLRIPPEPVAPTFQSPRVLALEGHSDAGTQPGNPCQVLAICQARTL